MSRTPDWRVKGLDKSTEARGKLGAGWTNPDGSITIVFDPFIDPRLLVRKDFLITLFPWNGSEQLDFFATASERLAAAQYGYRAHALCPAVIAAYCNVDKYGCEIAQDYVLVRQARRELVFFHGTGDPRGRLPPRVRTERLVYTEASGVFPSTGGGEICYDLRELLAEPLSSAVARGIKFAARDGVEIADYPEADGRLREVYDDWRRGKEADPKVFRIAFNPARYLRSWLLPHSFSIFSRMVSIRERPYGFINFALAGDRAYELSFLSRFRDPEQRLINDQNVCIMAHCLAELAGLGITEVNLGPAAGIRGLQTFKRKLPHSELLIYCGRA